MDFNKEMQEELCKMLNGETDFPFVNLPEDRATPQTNNERIIAHMKAVSESKIRPGPSMKNTRDSVRKEMRHLPDVSTLKPIAITELEPIRIPYHGRVLFCTIVTPPLVMLSTMTLVEDETGGLADLAVYNMANAENELCMGREIAIIEPFYKVRADGTPGIRVDDPSEILFDVESPSTLSETTTLAGTSTIEVEALTEAEAPTPSVRTDTTPQLIPDRRPKSHRYAVNRESLRLRDEGNEAFKSRQFEKAEHLYTAALNSSKKSLVKELPEDRIGVELWTLYSNRSMARIKLGKPDLALKDAAMSHTCAPAGTTKPFVRCIQALVAFGYRSEALAELEASRETYTDKAMIMDIERKLRSTNTLRVGSSHPYKTIKAALFASSPGDVILVEAGLYTDPLIVTKPVTIRSVAPIPNDLTPVDSDVGDWAEIRVQWAPPVVVDLQGNTADVALLIGFRIVSTALLEQSLQAVSVGNESSCVLRLCKISSTSGPAVGVLTGAQIMAEECAIYDSSQGGVLACDDGKLVLRNVQICYNAANGLEIRSGASAKLENCHVFANGRQGILIWHGAGDIEAKGCHVHSHKGESGVLVMENAPSLADFRECEIYSNSCAGIAIQTGGKGRIAGCKVRHNCEGVLIQSSSAATVENCEVFNNTANGIFVGYDHMGTAGIFDNDVHDNQFKGIILGTGRNKRNVQVKGNKEHGNRGLPASIPSEAQSTTRNWHKATDSRKWAKTVKKSKAPPSINTRDRAPSSLFETVFDEKIAGAGAQRSMADAILGCAFCHKQPEKGVKFKKCSKCQAVYFCSRSCQVSHWKAGHKAKCTPPAVKHPAFIDPYMSV